MEATAVLSADVAESLETSVKATPSHPSPVTDPAAEALGLLSSLGPGAAAANRDRIAAVGREIADKVEDARLRLDEPLDRFIREIGRLILLRRKLEARIPHLSMDAESPRRPPVAEEVCETVRRVKRWRDGQALYQEHARRFIAQLGRQIAENESQITNLTGGYTQGHDFTIRFDTRQYQGGLTGRDDEFLSRAEPLLATRAELATRLASLAPHGLPWWQEQVRSAIGDQSALDTLRDSLAPAQAVPAQGELARAASAVSETHMSLQKIDLESERAQALAQRLDDLREREQGARTRLKQQQLEAAAALLNRALDGTDSSISALAANCRAIGRVELAERLEAIGATDDVMVATIDEILRQGNKPVLCPVCKAPRN